MDPKEMVRAGYNAIADEYLATRTQESPDVELLDEFERLLPDGAAVLDAGCGAGMPVALRLSSRYRVTGVDFADNQLDRARVLVPGAEFVCQDLTALDLPPESFDATVSYYAIIHIPREEHPLVFRGVHSALRPGGLALLCIGAADLPTDVADYHGVPMFWSHFGPDDGLAMLRDCGFQVVWSKTVVDMTEPGAGHLFVLCHKA